MRDNELHGHAAGAPTPMDMMGHGHMMMDGGHGSMSGGHGATHSGHAPGMVKMSAPPDQVDYVPEGAHDPSGHAEPDEHEPEMHLDHTDPARRKAGFKAAPIAPPMEHGAHAGHEMDTPEEEPAPDEPAPDEPAVDHEAMGHTPAERVETPAETPAPSPAPAMDHSQHAH